MSCGATRRKLCENKTCKSCFDRSFASHLRSKFWSPDNKKTPRQVTKSSHTKFKFLCNNKKCGHTFEVALHKITNSKTWCPFCCKTSQRLCPDSFTSTGCDVCYAKSFAPNPRSEFWSPKNEGQPWEYMANNHNKFIFDCPNPECLHEFESSLLHISKDNRWCPFCAKPSKRLCPDTSAKTGCQICRAKTFATHPRAEFWSKKNKKKPEQVFLNSHDKYKFICGDPGGCNKEFEILPYSIVGRNSWCPACKTKTEAKLFKWLHDNKYVVKKPAKFDWCKNPKTGRFLPFDFMVGDVIIEIDGPQHFVQISNWRAPEETQLVDRLKERHANRNGKSVVRLLQEDVLSDNPKSKWKTLLKLSLSRERETPDISHISFPKYEGREIRVEYQTIMNFVGQNEILIF
jgi:hypothetical protein